MAAKKSVEKKSGDVPDLGRLLREATRAAETVTVPLKQGLAGRIRAAEVELSELLAQDGFTPERRMAAGDPLVEKAAEVEALRAEMGASALTFTFTALSREERERIAEDMDGRDDLEEINLRAVALMCRSIVDAEGNKLSDGWTFEQASALRESLGVETFESTVDEAAGRAAGVRWSVPFSPTASRILETRQ